VSSPIQEELLNSGIVERVLETKATEHFSASTSKIDWTTSLTMPLGEILKMVESEPERRMVYSVIMEGSTGIIYGVAKTGKTIFCENLGMSIAAGRNEYLGQNLCCKNSKVLILSFEENYINRSRRNKIQLSEFSEDEIQKISENYFVANKTIPDVIATEEDWQMICKEVELHMPGLVILDSLTRLVNDPIEAVEPSKKAMLRLRELSKEFQTTVLCIHHSTKMEIGQPMTQQNLAGSRVVSQEADFIIGLNRTITNQRYFKIVSARYASDIQEEVETFKINDDLSIELTGKAKELDIVNLKTDGRINETNGDKIYNHFLNRKGSDIETMELKQEFVDSKKMSEPTLQAQLKKLINKNQILKLEHGKYRITP
jgi:hypothetical protein